MSANVHDITNAISQIKETIKVGTTVTASFTTLVDLGTTSLYRNLYIDNTCNQLIVLRFITPDGDNYDVTIDITSEKIILPNFYHNGLIQIKAVSTIPTSGQLKVWSF